MEEQNAEQKKAFIPNKTHSGGHDKKSRKGRPVEVKYDLSKNYKKRLRSPGGGKLVSLTVLDHVIVLTVVLANVVGFWRGLFGIFSQFQDVYHLIFLHLLGSAVICHFTIARSVHKRHLTSNTIWSSIVRKAYTYIFGCACIAQWAGLWFFLDEMTGFEVYPPLTYSVVCSVILICLKLYRNVLAPPVTFCIDHVNGYFEYPTAFKTDPSEEGTTNTPLYVLDCFFTVFVIGSLVVFVWRGVWCLTDVFLYPENEEYSAFSSLAIGYGIIIVVFSTQVPMENLCEKLTGLWRLLVADVYIFIAFVGTINLWRGLWNLLNIYFLPESPLLSCWITHLGSFAFLVLINCSNSALVRGVYLDGEEGGKCVAFPISYLRLIFKKHLNEKEVKSKTVHKNNSAANDFADVEKGQKENSENGKDLARTNDEIKS